MRLLTPARSAMLSTRAPSYPLSVNSFTAAARIAALVDSGSRVVAVRTCFSGGRPEAPSEFDCVLVLPARRIFGSLAGDLAIGIILGLNFEKSSRWLSSHKAGLGTWQNRSIHAPVPILRTELTVRL